MQIAMNVDTNADIVPQFFKGQCLADDSQSSQIPDLTAGNHEETQLAFSSMTPNRWASSAVRSHRYWVKRFQVEARDASKASREQLI